MMGVLEKVTFVGGKMVEKRFFYFGLRKEPVPGLKYDWIAESPVELTIEELEKEFPKYERFRAIEGREVDIKPKS